MYYEIPKPRPKLLPTVERFKGASGEKLITHGKFMATIEICGHSVQQEVYVVDIGQLPALMGFDILKTGISIDFGSGILSYKGVSTQLQVRQVSPFAHVCICQSYTIKPYTAVRLPGYIEKGASNMLPTEDLLLESRDTLYDDVGLTVPNMLVKHKEDRVPVLLMNPSPKAIYLEKGTRVADVSKHVSIKDMLHNSVPSQHDSKSESSDNTTSESHVNDNDISDSAINDNDILVTETDTGFIDHLPPHMAKTLEKAKEYLTQEEYSIVVELLREFIALFPSPGGKIGRTNIMSAKIDIQNSEPVKQKLRRLPLARRKILEDLLKDLLGKDVIEPSTSPWSSNVVLVRKDVSPDCDMNNKDNWRLCVDYRVVNSLTKKDAYPLPRIEACLDQLHGSKYFCVLDLESGFYQVPLDENSRDITAFSTHLGLFRYKVLSMGLCNAPAIF